MTDWRCWDGPNRYAEVIAMSERPDPLAEPEGYGQPARPAAGPVTHSITCVLQGCILPASCCLYLGDVNEHIAHLCLCATDCYKHERMLLSCAVCGEQLKIIKREPTPGGAGEEYDVHAGLQRLMDWMNEPTD